MTNAMVSLDLSEIPVAHLERIETLLSHMALKFATHGGTGKVFGRLAKAILDEARARTLMGAPGSSTEVRIPDLLLASVVDRALIAAWFHRVAFEWLAGGQNAEVAELWSKLGEIFEVSLDEGQPAVLR